MWVFGHVCFGDQPRRVGDRWSQFFGDFIPDVRSSCAQKVVSVLLWKMPQPVPVPFHQIHTNCVRVWSQIPSSVNSENAKKAQNKPRPRCGINRNRMTYVSGFRRRFLPLIYLGQLINAVLKPIEEYNEDAKLSKESARLPVKIAVWSSLISNLGLCVLQGNLLLTAQNSAYQVQFLQRTQQYPRDPCL